MSRSGRFSCQGSRSLLDGSIIEARGSIGPGRYPREPPSARRRRQEEEQDGGGGRPEDEGHELVKRVLLAAHRNTAAANNTGRLKLQPAGPEAKNRDEAIEEECRRGELCLPGLDLTL